MIFQYLYQQAIRAIGYIISFLPAPDATVLTYIDETFNPFKSHMYKMGFMLPISDFFVILSIIIVMELSFLGVRVFKFIVGVFRGM